MILLIAGQKGGTGKTTIATNLAAIASATRDVLLVDMDFQGSAGKFISRRETALFRRQPVPRIHYVQRRGNVFADLQDLGNRYDEVIVDVGGSDSEEFRTALPACDVLLSPLSPYGYDLDTCAFIADLVSRTRDLGAELQARWVLSRARTRSRDHLDARELLTEDYTELHVDKTIVWERQPMSDSAHLGRGVIEMAKNTSQADVLALARGVYGQQIQHSKAA